MMNKKLYRLKDDRKISGVCSGIAAYLGVDATIIRLLWVLICLFSAGVGGVLLYLACALIVPEEPEFYEAQYQEKR